MKNLLQKLIYQQDQKLRTHQPDWKQIVVAGTLVATLFLSARFQWISAFDFFCWEFLVAIFLMVPMFRKPHPPIHVTQTLL
jgi:hypothetical protein